MMNHKVKTPLTPKKNRVAIFKGVLLALVGVAGISLTYVGLPDAFPIQYNTALVSDLIEEEPVEAETVTGFVPIRLATPKSVKAIYMTQCVVGTPTFRDKLVRLAEETEINAIVIDIKDYTGRLGFVSENPELKDALSENCYAPDMKEFIKAINEKGIYAIARITVFQDPTFALKRPDLAVQKESDRSTWKDYKGLSFIDVGAREAWDYILAISREAYEIGFDELNYDYIRFPSDGPMWDIYYPFSEERVTNNPDTGKAEILEEFFAYLNDGLSDLDVVTSADLFGMVTTNTDDLNIGQQLERALPYFDYIAPMIYPSHYPTGFNGWVNPNEHIYDVISYTMTKGIERITATSTTVETLKVSVPISTTTIPLLYVKKAYPATKFRPWLQDFDYGGNYDETEVRAQIQAAYDVGLDSWMLWSSSNIYTEGALEKISATASST